jgi:hypothetical protein
MPLHLLRELKKAAHNKLLCIQTNSSLHLPVFHTFFFERVFHKSSIIRAGPDGGLEGRPPRAPNAKGAPATYSTSSEGEACATPLDQLGSLSSCAVQEDEG